MKRATSKPAAKARPSRWPKRKGGAKRPRGKTILHTCGHSQVHTAKGAKQKWQKDRNAEYLATQPCTACWSEAQAQEAESFCTVQDLPPLKGTARQVAWARSIRAVQLGRITGEAARLKTLRIAEGLPPASDEFLDLVLKPALKQREAKWWVDTREDSRAYEMLLSSTATQRVEALFQEAEDLATNNPCPF